MNFCGLLGPAVLLTGMQHTWQTMEKVNPAATPSERLGWLGGGRFGQQRPLTAHRATPRP